MSISAVKTVIVLGSGGHTMEMCEIVKSLDKTKYKPRTYILAKSDITSRTKIEEIEETDQIEFIEILRSRNVHQSYFTAIFTTLLAIINCFPLCWRIQPDLILCNGPGTCVPICIVAFILKWLKIIPKTCKICFIESFCRVKTLSLSGKILLKFADMFVIQWPDLLLSINEKDRKSVKYCGRLL